MRFGQVEEEQRRCDAKRRQIRLEARRFRKSIAILRDLIELRRLRRERVCPYDHDEEGGADSSPLSLRVHLCSWFAVKLEEKLRALTEAQKQVTNRLAEVDRARKQQPAPVFADAAEALEYFNRGNTERESLIAVRYPVLRCLLALDRFGLCRREWDKYIVPPGHGARVPAIEVFPGPPSSKEWAARLHGSAVVSGEEQLSSEEFETESEAD